MPNEDNDRCEEIDLISTDISVSGGWTTQIPVANSILIPQQLSNLSRTNSLASNDYEMKTIDHTDTL
jgi:hypothetical protein